MVAAPPVRWWVVEVVVPTALADDAAALAVGAGADGAEIEELDQHTTRLRLSFPGEHVADEVRALTNGALAEIGFTADCLSVRERIDTDWSERWKQYFEPLNLGKRVWIVPSWYEGFSPPTDAATIELDPGMAFGTGQHATTAMCVEWLEEHLATGDGLSVLDVGCGSGILSMASARLGAGRVVGIDNDPVAVEVARENARDNNLDLIFSEQPLAGVSGTFEVVVANILAHTLCELAVELVRHTAPGGWLVLSGIHEEQEQDVLAAIAAVCTQTGRPQFTPTARRLRKHWLVLGAQL